MCLFAFLSMKLPILNLGGCEVFLIFLIAEEVRPETLPRFGASKQPSSHSISFSCETQGNVCGNGSCVETERGYHCACPQGEEYSSMVGYCVGKAMSLHDN